MTKQLTPEKYARHTLERYTGSTVDEFCSYILLVNFPHYLEQFSEITGAPIQSGYWSAAHDPDRGVSIINFGVGSPSAGILMHCLSAVARFEGALMLGMCGGIDEGLKVGELLIPTASVRDEGTSQHYLPKDVPAQPSFWINRICEEVIIHETGLDPKSGMMLTTDYRMWEFDKEFIDYILRHRIIAIDMEIATVFSVAYALNLPTGAIMLVSDLPLKKGGIKSKQSSDKVFSRYTDQHLTIALKCIERIKQCQGTDKSGRIKCEW
ncbi:AMP nucleosidase [Thermodesulfobacteriota bacterium]